MGSSLGPPQQLSRVFYIRSCFGICQEVLMPTWGQTARISFFSLTLPSHSSLFQNTHDYLTSSGPWPKPPPPSFLIFIQDFCRSFVYRNLKHYFLSITYRFFFFFLLCSLWAMSNSYNCKVAKAKVRSNSKTWIQSLGRSLLLRKDMDLVCHLHGDATGDSTNICRIRLYLSVIRARQNLSVV